MTYERQYFMMVYQGNILKIVKSKVDIENFLHHHEIDEFEIILIEKFIESVNHLEADFLMKAKKRGHDYVVNLLYPYQIKGINQLPIQLYDTYDLDFEDNKMIVFKGFPIYVHGTLNIANNLIQNFQDAPHIIDGQLLAMNCQLKNLKNMPLVRKNIYLANNKIESLEGIQSHVYGSLSIGFNQLKNLQYGPEIIENNLMIYGNKIETFNFFPDKINGKIYCYDQQIDIDAGPRISCVSEKKRTDFSFWYQLHLDDKAQFENEYIQKNLQIEPSVKSFKKI